MEQRLTPIETAWLPEMGKEVKSAVPTFPFCFLADSTIGKLFFISGSTNCHLQNLLRSQLRTFKTMLEATVVLIEMLLCLASMVVNLVIAISIRFVSFYGSETLRTVFI